MTLGLLVANVTVSSSNSRKKKRKNESSMKSSSYAQKCSKGHKKTVPAIQKLEVKKFRLIQIIYHCVDVNFEGIFEKVRLNLKFELSVFELSG